MTSSKTNHRPSVLKKVWQEYRHNLLGVVVVLFVAIFLRIYNIFSIPIFADEAIYIRWAQVMRSVSSLRFLPLSDGKQPLFMWVTIPFLKVFEDPLLAGRMVSICTGILSMVGIFFLTLALFKSRKTALLASFFYAISPFAVFFDRLALVDSMLTMFGIWCVFFAVLAAKYLRLDTAMLAGFSLGGAWLTKSPGIFFLILLPATTFLASLPKHVIGLKSIKLLALWIVIASIGSGLYNILRLGPEFHMIAIRNQDYVFPISHAFTNPFDPFQVHLREIVEWFWVLIPGSVLLAAIFGVVLGARKYWREILLLISWLLLPLLAQAEFAKVFTARYIFFTIPPIFILASLAFTQLLKLRVATYWVVVGLFSLPALWINYLLLTSPEKAPLPRVERSGYLEAWTAGVGIREIAEYIKKEQMENPSRNIIVGTEGYFGTTPDGLQIYIEDLPGVTVKGLDFPISEVDSSLVNAKKTGDKVYLVVNQSRFTANSADLGLKLVGSYPKAINPKEIRDELLFFEVLDESVKIYNTKHALPL